MSDDIVIIRMNDNEKRFDKWQIKNYVDFSGDENDKINFVYFRYLHLKLVDGYIDSNMIDDIFDQQEKYQKNGSKIQNFVKMYFVDYFWIKSQFILYDMIANDKKELNDNILFTKKQLKG